MPIAPSCPTASLFERLPLGQFSTEEIEQFAQHVEQCPRCAAAVEALANDTLVEALKAKSTKLDRLEGAVVSKLAARLKQLRPVVESSEATAAFASVAAPVAPVEEGTQEVYDFLAPPRAPGEIGWLGPYRVLKILGVGGMGVVFQAEDPGLKRMVALKAMKRAIAANSSARLRFLREAQTAAAVKNDHVVTIYQVGEDRGVPYLAMEFLEGEPLDGWLKRGRQPNLAQLLRMGREMAMGLEAAHARGLIHRDIKPGNIWLEMPKGRIKLLDFGLARAAASDVQVTESGAIVGTPAYMAPEQARGEKVDPRADLFSLGCVLYRLATGTMPFKGVDTMSVLLSLAMDTPRSPREINPQLPPSLNELIEKLLSKDPAGRPASAKVVVQALQAMERDTRQPASDERTMQVGPASVSAPVVGAASVSAPVVGAASVSAPVATPARSRARFRWLVAASLLVLLGGIVAAAIIIRIKSPDGQVTEIKVPDGAVVEISNKDEAKKPTVQVPFLLPAANKIPDKDKPFVLLRAGKTVREFKTFAGILAELQNDDVVEVHANGPLFLPRIALTGCSLNLRAGPGYRPRFVPVPGLRREDGHWIQVKNAPLLLEGCEFLLLGRQGIGGSGDLWEIRRCSLVMCDGHDHRSLISFAGKKLRLTDCYLERSTSYEGLAIGPKVELEIINCIWRDRSWMGYFISPAGPGGQKIHIERSSFISYQGGPICLPPQHQDFKDPVSLQLDGNLFDTMSAIVNAHMAPKVAARLKELVRWEAHDNLYVRRGFSTGLMDFSNDPMQPPSNTLAAWNALWGKKDEPGSKLIESVAYHNDAMFLAPTPAEQIEAVRAVLNEQRRRSGGSLADVGPNADLLGPGEGYLRALAAAGKAVPDDKLRPEALEGGGVVLLRDGKEIRGYTNLQESTDAAQNGDILEIRTEGNLEGCNRSNHKDGKRLTVRAAPGYRPTVSSMTLGVGDRWTLEGIHFTEPLNYNGSDADGRIVRLANCSIAAPVAGGFWRSGPNLSLFAKTKEDAPIEIINCLLPGQTSFQLAVGQKVRIANSVMGAIVVGQQLQEGTHSFEFDRCLFCWQRGDAQSVQLLGRDKGKSTLTVHAEKCLFDLPSAFVAPQQGFKYSGDFNVFRVRGASWYWDHRPDEDIRDLAAWRKRWNSDVHSVEDDPLRYDPRQWRLLLSSPGHGTAPGGKDYGADVDKIATTPPSKP